jgi:nucleoid-associated protein YgaU
MKRMVIKAYKDPELTQPAGIYAVRVNPEKYSHSMQVRYDAKGAIGTINTPLRFGHIPPSTLNFELLFDATGAIPDSAADLADEIDRFLKVVYHYQGHIHEPHYLRLIWGSLHYAARLTSVEFQYTLFSPTGAPLRARATVAFTNFADPEKIVSEQDDESADLTHARTVKEGDTLLSIAREVYGDPSRYVQLARHNGLPSTRRPLQAGMKLVCPPVK